MPTKAERKAEKKARREADAQRVADNPAEAILGKPTGEEPEQDKQALEQIVKELREDLADEPAGETEATEPAEDGKPAEETEPEASEKPEDTTEQPEAKAEALSLEDMVKGLSPEVREAALESIAKLRAQAEKNEANKKYAQFDARMKDPEKGIDAWIKIDGKNIEHLPLLERKNFLSRVLVETSNVEIAPYTEDALALWNNVIIAQSLEGMVGKDKAGRYVRDARNWQKVKAWKRNYGRSGSTGETFLVVGYTKGTGWRESTFGAMVLARLEKDGTSIYVGEVGTGMNNSEIAGLMSMFITGSCPWAKEPEQATWVKPFAVKIQYLETTNEGLLRFPSFKGVV